MLKVIIFDFDGVIVDSNRIKKDTYFELFKSFKNGASIVGRVLSKYEPNTRKYLISKIINGMIKEKTVKNKQANIIKQRYVSRYGYICEEKIKKCKGIKGASDSIKNLAKKYHLYIISITPRKTLRNILKYRKLLRYFVEVFGGEKSKLDNFKRIIKSESIVPKQAVIIGDGLLDYKLGKASGAHFIGIDNEEGLLRQKKIKYFLSDCGKLYNMINNIKLKWK